MGGYWWGPQFLVLQILQSMVKLALAGSPAKGCLSWVRSLVHQATNVIIIIIITFHRASITEVEPGVVTMAKWEHSPALAMTPAFHPRAVGFGFGQAWF